MKFHIWTGLERKYGILNNSCTQNLSLGICTSWTECKVLHLSRFEAKRWNFKQIPFPRTFLHTPKLKKQIGTGKNRCCNKPATGLFSSAIGLFSSVIGLQQADYRLDQACCKQIADKNKPVAGRLQAQSSLLQANYRRKQAGCRPITDENKPVADENGLDRACNRLNVDAIKVVWEPFKMVFMRKRMVKSPFQPVLRWFENVFEKKCAYIGLERAWCRYISTQHMRLSYWVMLSWIWEAALRCPYPPISILSIRPLVIPKK